MPIKRNLNIVLLSKDHHFGLLFCWKIQEGIKHHVNLSRIKSYIEFFWSQQLSHHFNEEEEVLLNVIEDDLCNKAKAEHQIISEEIAQIINDKKCGIHHYLQLVNLLNQHIRFEERVLFPHLELILSEQQLMAIGDFLSKTHTDFTDDFADEFWLESKLNNIND